ncbi:MAG TPA: rhodanese-like domain-containing protein [Puia sp.]|uniref:rhodanese-like domain-containing protein n=1 Tax=Puia sp. TaxID=2045100 RepID=UPI002D1D1C88|nr:rhodanese-like domain-containing protein [Puia sp.]HVU94395.1 rhodanese-like domain-containing protein [Puia sp.]
MRSNTIAMKLALFAVLLGVASTTTAQQSQLYDNTTYKAIYFKTACDLIAKTPDLLLLDVRSPGEYADTSRFIASRIGRLKGAVNISIDSVKIHYNDLLPYKNKPILVYCSHSMRSRRVSKFLADSGFTQVYSLNGGMTEISREPNAAFPCRSSLYTTNVPYRLMGPEDAANFIKNRSNVIIDVRPPAQFNGTDTIEANNIGRITNAVNVPAEGFDPASPGLEKYKDKPILVYDLYTDRAMTAAAKLKAAGFKDVAVLFDGFDTFLLSFSSSSATRRQFVTAAPAWSPTGVREAIDLINQSAIVADVRPIEEFGNKATPTYHNLGHLKNAVNFPTAAKLEEYLKDKPKNTPVLVYAGFSAANRQINGGPDPAPLCKKLAAEGFTNIHLLYDGLYSVVWASANVDGQQDAKSILVDHEGLY